MIGLITEMASSLAKAILKLGINAQIQIVPFHAATNTANSLNFGDGLNTVSESTVSSTEVSEFFDLHRVAGEGTQ